jgi:hypothetical protein
MEVVTRSEGEFNAPLAEMESFFLGHGCLSKRVAIGKKDEARVAS